MSAFDQSLRLGGEDVDVLLALGSAALRLPDAGRALDAYARATEVVADSPAGWLGRGRALVLLDRPDEARGCFRRALLLAPTSTLASKALESLER